MLKMASLMALSLLLFGVTNAAPSFPNATTASVSSRISSISSTSKTSTTLSTASVSSFPTTNSSSITSNSTMDTPSPFPDNPFYAFTDATDYSLQSSCSASWKNAKSLYISTAHPPASTITKIATITISLNGAVKSSTETDITTEYFVTESLPITAGLSCCGKCVFTTLGGGEIQILHWGTITRNATPPAASTLVDKAGFTLFVNDPTLSIYH